MNYRIVLDTLNFAYACDTILETLDGHVHGIAGRPAMVRCEYPNSDNNVVLRISMWNPLIKDHHYLVDNMSELLALVFRLKYSGMPVTPAATKEPSSRNEDMPFKRTPPIEEVKVYRKSTGVTLKQAAREVQLRNFFKEFATWRESASTTGKIEFILDWIAEQEA